MFAKIIGGVLIMLSDTYKPSYGGVIEIHYNEPYNSETHYLSYKYEIRGEKVFKVYELKEIEKELEIEGENEDGTK